MSKYICKEYKKGASIKDLCIKYNLYFKDVKSILTDGGVTLRSRGDRNKLRKRESAYHQYQDKWIELYKAGVTLNQISVDYSCNPRTVKYWLKKWGIVLRTKKETGLQGAATRRKDCQDKYGVDHPMQVKEIFEKRSKQMYKFYTHEAAGREFTVQGFEGQAINLLLERGVDVDDILVGKDVPRIEYHFRKDKVYYPDIYIECLNTIFEVKSLYTYNIEKERNIAKAKAAAACGYKHVTLIFDNKGKELIEESYTV